MLRIGVVSLLFAVGLSLPASAAPRGKGAASAVRPLAVSAAAQKEMSRYSLRAFENGDAENRVKALLYTPKPDGIKRLPMIVYIPGRGELGDVAAHFRQRTIFDRVTERDFQRHHPCFLLALTPPREATTLLGGMPGHPTAMQKAIAIPDSVTHIHYEAFGDCGSLSSVTIPANVESIDETAFVGTPFLDNAPDGLIVFSGIAYPQSLRSVGGDAFRGCPIEKVYVEKGDAERVKEMLRGKGIDVERVEFVERNEAHVGHHSAVCRSQEVKACRGGM